MLKRMFLMMAWMGACVPIFAQGTSTSHVFPQVADGSSADGTGYVSLLFVTNRTTTPTTCTFSVSGFAVTRFTAGGTLSIPANSWLPSLSRAELPLATGYGRLSCTVPVSASLMYAWFDQNGNTLSMATVFSAPNARYALIPAILGVGFRYGIAIANDNDTPATISLLVGYNGQSVGRTISIPARGQYVAFVDQIVTLPNVFAYGTIEITSVGTGVPINVMGLIYEGSAFTTIVPVAEP